MPNANSSKACSAVPTQGETARIKRALYRFEIFCNVFRRTRPRVPVPDEYLDHFCCRFSPWENEQMGCIQDFLFRLVSPVVNELAAHDVAWGEFRVEPALNPSSITLQGVLSLGLENLYGLGNAETYAQKLALLPFEHPPVRPDFLYRALGRARLRNESKGEDNKFISSQRPFFTDPDSGPSDAWNWGYQRGSELDIVNHPDRMGLRRWAYVMWDLVRLNNSHILRFPWQDNQNLLWQDSPSLVDEQWQESWTRRSEIYGRGGRGWWTSGDESQIVFPVSPRKRLRHQAPGVKKRPFVSRSI
ncbi:hypothetical protein B0O99DRAFT_603455 [Bisporella sp. PMI_857]|nr:hypothetical protein B0O99DRAFT_603455 [Bisporella sp. PMI_857]